MSTAFFRDASASADVSQRHVSSRQVHIRGDIEVVDLQSSPKECNGLSGLSLPLKRKTQTIQRVDGDALFNIFFIWRQPINDLFPERNRVLPQP